jgi:hypothetical protein
VAVTDQLAQVILGPEAKLELRVPVRWSDRLTSVRAEMAVHNTHGLAVVVGLQVTKDKPWKPTAYLMTEGVHLRRLDINGRHTNRFGEHEQWRWRTHKHRWCEAHQTAWAYTPQDIPEVPLSGVTHGHLQSVFEAFLDECGIVRGGAYVWSNPGLGLTAARSQDEEA